MLIDEASIIKKILVISLTNIGDAVLTFPVIDVLINAYPAASISVMSSPKSKSLFESNPHIKKTYVYDKRKGLFEKVKFFLSIRRERFDCVVDLKNSAIPFLAMSKYATKPEVKRMEDVHMRQKHVERLKTVYNGNFNFSPRNLLVPCATDISFINGLLENFIAEDEHYVVVAPGSLNEYKRWNVSKFRKVCQKIISDYNCKIVFVGDGVDGPLADRIVEGINENTLNLCGNTTLIQCAEIIRRSILVITNDSGPMHIASYLNKPIVAIFGPSKVHQYAPWSDQSVFLKGQSMFYNNDLQKDQTSYTDINSVTVEQVLNSFSISKGIVQIYCEKNV